MGRKDREAIDKKIAAGEEKERKEKMKKRKAEWKKEKTSFLDKLKHKILAILPLVFFALQIISGRLFLTLFIFAKMRLFFSPFFYFGFHFYFFK